MNPLTQVKNTQKITAREAAAGISEQGSWHERYKDSAYVYIGGLPFDLTEGDLLAVFAQYGEIVDVNLVRDKGTGKSKGFAFVAYENQKSTVLAVDNLNGARVIGRIIRVDHVADYKKKKEEDEEEEQRKREERGVCYQFQRGECNRGASCKYSHDEQRNANTGWGKKEDGPTWGRKDDGPLWKSGNGAKDNGPPPPPPWRQGSSKKDDGPPPWRADNKRKDDSASHWRLDNKRDDKLPSRHGNAEKPRSQMERQMQDGSASGRETRRGVDDNAKRRNESDSERGRDVRSRDDYSSRRESGRSRD